MKKLAYLTTAICLLALGNVANAKPMHANACESAWDSACDAGQSYAGNYGAVRYRVSWSPSTYKYGWLIGNGASNGNKFGWGKKWRWNWAWLWNWDYTRQQVTDSGDSDTEAAVDVPEPSTLALLGLGLLGAGMARRRRKSL